MIPQSAHAESYSIPVVGRWTKLQIGLEIPSTPVWAHDLVLNASRVWNSAQVWFRYNFFPEGSVYSFVESHSGNVTISFSIPAECASIAVGWTQYILAAPSTILGARVFLDGRVFDDSQEPNSTIRTYALWVALHELGRVLGLGSLLDGHDIMDPVGTVTRGDAPPLISFIDLFALHMLATEPFLSSSVIVLNTDQQASLNAWDLLGLSPKNQVATRLFDPTAICPVRSAESPICYV